jgi:hypothetical protein
MFSREKVKAKLKWTIKKSSREFIFNRKTENKKSHRRRTNKMISVSSIIKNKLLLASKKTFCGNKRINPFKVRSKKKLSHGDTQK